MTEEQQANTSPETEVDSESGEDNNITLNDLYAAIQIIDVATKRGAFSAAEAGGVGMTYSKIRGFLETAAPHLFEENGGNRE